MKAARILRSVASTLTVGLLAFFVADCADEPKPNCIATLNPFAVKLIEQGRVESTAGACMGFGPDSFNADPEIGLSPYYARDSKGQPDYSKGSLAIRTAEMGGLLDTAQTYGFDNTAPDANLNAFGAFNVSEPDANEFCTVPAMSVTHLVLPDIPAVMDDPTTPDDNEAFPGQAAVDIKLEWTNVQVYVTAASYGTQMQAQLVDTRRTSTGDTCAITYKAVALAPAVPCQKLDTDDNPLTNPDGTPQLDITLCDPNANPALDRFIGSGISVNTRYTCDPVTAFCAIYGDTVPALLP